MRILLWVVLTLVAAGVIAYPLLQDPGYVLLGYGKWTVETSAAVLVVVLALGFAVLYYALRAFAGVRAAPRRLRRWRQIKRGERARRYLSQGLVELAEGNWVAAERSLLRQVDASDTALLNYLGAARAAQQRGDSERRDQYLKAAHESMPSADVAVGLTQADLQLAQGQYEQALATASHLQRIAPRHAHVLKLLHRLYYEVGDWERLREILPDLRRRRVLGDDELDALTREVHEQLLAAAAQGGDALHLNQAWNRVPKDLRRDPAVIGCYAQHLLSLGEGAAAERLLARAIGSQWDGELVRLYGLAEAADEAAQLRRAESWLQDHPQDPALLLSLARLAQRNRLWGKARIYLESAIGAGAPAEAYRNLAVLLEQMGDRDAALEWYRKGMGLLAGAGPALPAPAPEDAPRLTEGAEREAES